MRVDLRIDPQFQKLWPALKAEEQQLLEQSLQAEGCRDALVVWTEEKDQPPILLDGHTRYALCTRLKIPFRTVAVTTVQTRADAIQWIGANQLGRRNLDASRKAAFALELEDQLAEEAKKRVRLNNASRAELPHSEKGRARDKAAELVGVNPRYISEAKAIKEKAPEVLEAVRQGKLNIGQAKQVAELPAEARPAAIERVKHGEAVSEVSIDCGDHHCFALGIEWARMETGDRADFLKESELLICCGVQRTRSLEGS